MKVFLSYSSTDEWVASQIKVKLESCGCEVFMAAQSLQTGDDWDERIQEAARDADEFAVVVSPASLGSSWVYMEIGAARVMNKRLAPILLNIGINEVPDVLKRHHARPLNELETYLEEIRGRIDAPDASAELAPSKETSDTLPEFRIGDWVKIAERPTINHDISRMLGWSQPMGQYRGQTTTVTGFTIQGALLLGIDSGQFAWSPEWLVPSSPPRLPPLSEILIR